jgi:hypothetical protein
MKWFEQKGRLEPGTDVALSFTDSCESRVCLQEMSGSSAQLARKETKIGSISLHPALLREAFRQYPARAHARTEGSANAAD